jgi:ATP-binding cassette subfamily B protein
MGKEGRAKSKSGPPSQGSELSWRILRANAWWAFLAVWRVAPRLTSALIGLSILESATQAAIVLVLGSMASVVRRGLEGAGGSGGGGVWLLVGAAGILLLGQLCVVGDRYLRARLGDEIRLVMSTRIFEHVLKLDLRFFEDSAAQDVFYRANQGQGGEFMSFVMDTLAAFAASVQLLFLVALLVWIHPAATVFLLLAGLPVVVVRWKSARLRYETDRAKTTIRRWCRYYLNKLSNAQSFPTIRLLQLGPELLERFRTSLKEVSEADRLVYRQEARGHLWSSVLFLLAMVGVVAYVATDTISQNLRFSLLIAYALGALRFRGAFETFGAKVAAAFERVLAIVNLREFFAMTALQAAGGPSIPASPFRGEIRLRDVSFAYPGQPRRVLEGLNLSIAAGETVALVGVNGSGKTTLAKLICRLYDVDGGTIEIDGVDLRSFEIESLGRQIAYVDQSSVRFEATAFENIAFGDWERLRNDLPAVREAAESVGMDQRILALPAGYDTLLGRMFGDYDMSGGQWQRLAIARALARDCSLYILDEPTAHMDIHAEYEVYQAIRRRLRDKTVVLISHRFSSAGQVDRIIVLDQGRIVDQGSHLELMEREGLYREMYNLHAQLAFGSVARQS